MKWISFLAVSLVCAIATNCNGQPNPADAAFLAAAVTLNSESMPPFKATYTLSRHSSPMNPSSPIESIRVEVYWSGTEFYQCIADGSENPVWIEVKNDLCTKWVAPSAIANVDDLGKRRRNVSSDNFAPPWLLTPSSYETLPEWLRRNEGDLSIVKNDADFIATKTPPDGGSLSEIRFSKEYGYLPTSRTAKLASTGECFILQRAHYTKKWDVWILDKLETRVTSPFTSTRTLVLEDLCPLGQDPLDPFVVKLPENVRIFDSATKRTVHRPVRRPKPGFREALQERPAL